MVSVLAGEAGSRDQSAQQVELPTAHNDMAQPSVYAVCHCSYLH